jgi:predicted PurR-regulated permease PerM
MEENTNQPVEAPKENTQKSNKLVNTVMIVLLILIILVLGIFIGYQLLKKSGGNAVEIVTTTGQTTTRTQTTTEEDTGTSDTTKSDIDGDMKNLDKLDLSGIENDYGEDQLSDL